MRVALAYSGDLKGSAAIQWLRDVRRADVVAVTIDLGQGAELRSTRDRALALGAKRAHVIDARERFAEHFIIPALRADALHDNLVPMAEALARPLIAQSLVEIAAIERADAVAHTSVTSGPSPYASRMDALLTGLGVTVPVLAPHREWTLTPDALTSFARAHGLTATSDVRQDVNVWGETAVVPVDAHRPPHDASRGLALPTETAHVDLTFERGIPTAINGVVMPVLEIVTSLATIGTMYGVGLTASAALECRAPAAVLLHLAHRELTRSVSDETQRDFSVKASRVYTDLVERSAWFSTLRRALDEYFTTTNAGLTGRVRLELHQGAAAVVAREGFSNGTSANQPSPSQQEQS